MHAPEMQASPVPQTAPPPQLQALSTQLSATSASQASPHPEQLAKEVSVSVQTPLQRISPSGQAQRLRRARSTSRRVSQYLVQHCSARLQPIPARRQIVRRGSARCAAVSRCAMAPTPTTASAARIVCRLVRLAPSARTR